MTAKQLRRGVYLPPFGPFGDAEVLVDLAVRAESAGWDGVFLWDHVVSDMPPIADCWTSLAAMAVETSRIKVGSTVTPVPRRRPWILARQASTVSRLSAGRLVVGVGLGSDESGDFSRFDEEQSLRARSSMLDAGLEIMRSMWTGEAYAATGPYEVDIPAGAAEPHHIPVWMASSTRHRRVLERASRCDGVTDPLRPSRTIHRGRGSWPAVDARGERVGLSVRATLHNGYHARLSVHRLPLDAP